MCNILAKCAATSAERRCYRIVRLCEVDSSDEAKEQPVTAPKTLSPLSSAAIMSEQVACTFAYETDQSDIEWKPDEFHERLSVVRLNGDEELARYYAEHESLLFGKYGVLLFLYTAMLTKVCETDHLFAS